jgi:hypothetical protein
MRRNLYAIKKNTHAKLNLKINGAMMYNVIGSILGTALIAAILTPLGVAIYLWIKSS